MFMGAIAGVDDGNVEMAGDEIGGAARGVAHDQAIRLHGVEGVHGIEQRFAFFEARGLGLKIHGVRAEAGGGRAKADACARGSFEESQGYRLTAKGSELFQRMALNFLERFALVEEKSEFVRGERFEGEQVAKAVGHIFTLAERASFSLR